ncbi:MAG: hypothetical protein MHM6MM_007388, partial [Cercozoa sp. M6MM]
MQRVVMTDEASRKDAALRKQVIAMQRLTRILGLVARVSSHVVRLRLAASGHVCAEVLSASGVLPSAAKLATDDGDAATKYVRAVGEALSKLDVDVAERVQHLLNAAFSLLACDDGDVAELLALACADDDDEAAAFTSTMAKLVGECADPTKRQEVAQLALQAAVLSVMSLVRRSASPSSSDSSPVLVDFLLVQLPEGRVLSCDALDTVCIADVAIRAALGDMLDDENTSSCTVPHVLALAEQLEETSNDVTELSADFFASTDNVLHRADTVMRSLSVDFSASPLGALVGTDTEPGVLEVHWRFAHAASAWLREALSGVPVCEKVLVSLGGSLQTLAERLSSIQNVSTTYWGAFGVRGHRRVQKKSVFSTGLVLQQYHALRVLELSAQARQCVLRLSADEAWRRWGQSAEAREVSFAEMRELDQAAVGVTASALTTAVTVCTAEDLNASHDFVPDTPTHIETEVEEEDSSMAHQSSVSASSQTAYVEGALVPSATVTAARVVAPHQQAIATALDRADAEDDDDDKQPTQSPTQTQTQQTQEAAEETQEPEEQEPEVPLLTYPHDADTLREAFAVYAAFDAEVGRSVELLWLTCLRFDVLTVRLLGFFRAALLQARADDDSAGLSPDEVTVVFSNVVTIGRIIRDVVFSVHNIIVESSVAETPRASVLHLVRGLGEAFRNWSSAPTLQTCAFRAYERFGNDSRAALDELARLRQRRRKLDETLKRAEKRSVDIERAFLPLDLSQGAGEVALQRHEAVLRGQVGSETAWRLEKLLDLPIEHLPRFVRRLSSLRHRLRKRLKYDLQRRKQRAVDALEAEQLDTMGSVLTQLKDNVDRIATLIKSFRSAAPTYTLENGKAVLREGACVDESESETTAAPRTSLGMEPRNDLTDEEERALLAHAQDLLDAQEFLPELRGWLLKKSPRKLAGWQKRWVAVSQYNVFYSPREVEILTASDGVEFGCNCIPLMVVERICCAKH